MGRWCQILESGKDKGYAWLVLSMAFISYVMHIGFSCGIVGNLTVIHSQWFDIRLQTSSLIGSAHMGVVCLLGEFRIFRILHVEKLKMF